MRFFITLFGLSFMVSCLANENSNINNDGSGDSKKLHDSSIEGLKRENIENTFEDDHFYTNDDDKQTFQQDVESTNQPKITEVDSSDPDGEYVIYTLPDPNPTAESLLDQENLSKSNDLENKNEYPNLKSNSDDKIIHSVWRRSDNNDQSIELINFVDKARLNLVSEIQPEHRSISTENEENVTTELEKFHNNIKSPNIVGSQNNLREHDIILKKEKGEENEKNFTRQAHVQNSLSGLHSDSSQTTPYLRRRRRPIQILKNAGSFKNFPPIAHPNYRQNLRYRKRQHIHGSRHPIEKQVPNIRTKYYQPQYDVTKYNDAVVIKHNKNKIGSNSNRPGNTDKPSASKKNINKSPSGDEGTHDSVTKSSPDNRIVLRNKYQQQPEPLDSQAKPSNFEQSEEYAPTEIGQWIHSRHGLQQYQLNSKRPLNRDKDTEFDEEQNLKNENQQVQDGIPTIQSNEDLSSETEHEEERYWNSHHDDGQQQSYEQQYLQDDASLHSQYYSDQKENLKYESSSNNERNQGQIVIVDGELSESLNLRNQPQQQSNSGYSSNQEIIQDLFSEHFFPGSSDHTQFPAQHSAPAFEHDSLLPLSIDHTQEDFRRPPLSHLAVQHLMHSIAKTPEQNLPPGPENVEIIKHVPYPVVRHVVIPIPQPYAVPVPHAVRVAVPRPYPIHVEVEKPVPYPVIKLQKIFVEKKIPYPVERLIPYAVEKPYPVPVIKKVHIPVDKTHHPSTSYSSHDQKST